MREPTQLTRPLQIGLAAYFLIFWGIAWDFAWPAISRYLATGQRNGAIVQSYSGIPVPNTERSLEGSDETSPKWRPPAWVRPMAAAFGLGFIVAAIGGPGSLGNLSSIGGQMLTATAASVAVGAGLAVWFAFRPRWVPMPFGNGVGIGAAVLLVIVIRLVTGEAPLFGSIIWGVFGGFMLAASAVPYKTPTVPIR